MRFLNWLLYEVHRWLGIVVGIFMFTWFLTGLAIMYATPTTQTHAQQLAHAEALAPEAGWLSLAEVWERSAGQREISAAAHKLKLESALADKSKGIEWKNTPAGIIDARLQRIHGEPVWLVEDTHGQRFALSAIDGAVREIGIDQSLTIARNWSGVNNNSQNLTVSYLETVDNPVILRNQEALRPFYRIAVGDAGNELLISSRTGEVLHASSRLDRAFYWGGNWLHLFKPLESLGYGAIRHDVQLWSGFIAFIVTLSGLIIGWLRWRPGFNGKRTYSEGRTQPYREFWFKWHFWTGLLGGAAALFWAFSGYIDTNPGKIFPQGDYTADELRRYLGEGAPEVARQWPLEQLLASGKLDDVVELNFRRLGPDAVLLAYTREGQRTALLTENLQPQFNLRALSAGVKRMVDGAEIESIELLHEYDSYYYPRHHQSCFDKPLPVVLAKVANAEGSRVYLDPLDGKLINKLDRSRRVFRWLYSALHHWDFGWLYYRPIWDLWMIAWVGLGLVLSVSSLVIGWRRLRKTFKPKKQRTVRSPDRLITGEFANQTAD